MEKAIAALKRHYEPWTHLTLTVPRFYFIFANCFFNFYLDSQRTGERDKAIWRIFLGTGTHI